MKRIILLLSFVCCSQSIFSQVPGYMGKRVSVSYQNTIFPDITGRDSKAIINSSQNVEINYIKKHSALCFTFMYFPIKLNTSFNSGYSYDYTFPDKVDYIKFNSFTYCIGLKLFLNRKKFAPIGTYLKFEVVYSTGKVAINEYNMRYNPESYYGYSYYSSPPPYVNFPAHKVATVGGGPAVSIGKQRVFFDKMIVDYGFRIGIVPVWAPVKRYNDTGYERAMMDKLDNVMLGEQAFNFKISIGFLPF